MSGCLIILFRVQPRFNVGLYSRKPTGPPDSWLLVLRPDRRRLGTHGEKMPASQSEINQQRTSSAGEYADRTEVQAVQKHAAVKPLSRRSPLKDIRRFRSSEMAPRTVAHRRSSRCHTATVRANVNPLKGSGVRWLHFEVFSAIQV